MTRKRLCYLLSFIAYFGMPIGIPFIRSAEPYVLGLPFLLFWMVLWILLGTGIMLIVHRINPSAREELE
ncbi:DUF3311 domain-containing protein [Lysinibacillus sp. NPDC097279]|uniref:DUF3311 domain-containing protein n=1 Tax=unclassified Lysinibacillus TaxID=2636778 RepID=UPI0011731DAB|nr:DUF3311 domain-containing protein [Lysinibacillus sp. CD3-6]QPQ35733.1 DUF3311 domain-containing protein [Lysinibacillus sp. JNUCC-52]UED78153.1 DUF3311 domain-containing protein [Lysinibacillus sp. CD3-6]